MPSSPNSPRWWSADAGTDRPGSQSGKEGFCQELVKNTLSKLVTQIRTEKNQLLRPQWLRYYNIWTLRGTEAAYHGRLRMYLPTGHRILENWVQKLRADLFPDSG